MVDVLEKMGVVVKIAHPNEVKATARAKIKTDKRDSEVLAHLLRMKMILEVYRRSKENRQAQRIPRQQAFCVSARTALKNRVHAFLAQQREEVRAGGWSGRAISFPRKGRRCSWGWNWCRERRGWRHC